MTKTTNAEPTQANSHTIVTAYDDQLSNGTSDHFFVSKMRKNLSKTTTKNIFPAKIWETNIRQQCIKKRLSDYIHSIATL